MAVPAVLAMVGQMAANQFQTDINRKLDRESNLKMMEQQQEYNLDMMAQQSTENRRNLMLSPSLLVNGLRNAGLNPAAAAGASTSVAGGSIGGTPSASQGSHVTPVDFIQANQQLANTEAIRAQTEKIKADTEKVQLENANASGESAAVRDSLLMSANRLKDVYKAFGIDTKHIDELENYVRDSKVLNVGSMRQIVKSFDIDKLLSSSLRDKLEDIFASNFAAKKIDEDIAGNTIEMSKFAKKLQARQYALMAQQIALMFSQKKVNEEQVKRIVQEVKNLNQDLINAQSNKQLTDQEFEHLKNMDVNTLFHEGKYGEAARALVVQVLQAAAGMTPFALMGKVRRGAAARNASSQPNLYGDSDDFNSILR